MDGNRIPLDNRRRWAWIKYQLELKGLSLAAIARDANVDRTTLYSVCHRHYPRMEQVLADALGIPVRELWADRYPVVDQGD